MARRPAARGAVPPDPGLADAAKNPDSGVLVYGRRHGHGESERTHNTQDRREFRVAVLVQRLVEAFAADACHPGGRIAVQRALTEVNQVLAIAVDAPHPWDRDTLSSTGFLYPAASMPATTHSTWQPIDAASLPAAIALCVGRIAAAGMDVLVVDKTRPDIGLSVVQVIAPGLCHFWPRFGARRLYSVPVALGGRAQPCDETALNPALLFL